MVQPGVPVFIVREASDGHHTLQLWTEGKEMDVMVTCAVTIINTDRYPRDRYLRQITCDQYWKYGELLLHDLRAIEVIEANPIPVSKQY